MTSFLDFWHTNIYLLFDPAPRSEEYVWYIKQKRNRTIGNPAYLYPWEII